MNTPGSAIEPWDVAGTAVSADHSPAWGSLEVVHAFAVRQPGVAVQTERAVAVERLGAAHSELRSELGLAQRGFCFAEQIHGSGVAVVEGNESKYCSGVDGLVTASEHLCLGIYTADCCAVYLYEPRQRVIGLVHAGAKGTRLGVIPATLSCMEERFGCRSDEILALLSPCIRPPHYEWDFGEEIRRQLSSAGVRRITDSGRCTGADTGRYYSYRMEKGKTGRMLALLALV